jgi:hypothetical protein
VLHFAVERADINIIVTSEKDLPENFVSMMKEKDKIYAPNLNEKMKEILKKDFEVSKNGVETISQKFLAEFPNQNNLLTTRNIRKFFVKNPVTFKSSSGKEN